MYFGVHFSGLSTFGMSRPSHQECAKKLNFRPPGWAWERGENRHKRSSVIILRQVCRCGPSSGEHWSARVGWYSEAKASLDCPHKLFYAVFGIKLSGWASCLGKTSIGDVSIVSI